MGKIKDQTGLTTPGNLLVESFAGVDKRGKAIWNCTCACGNRVTVRGRDKTRSCGNCPNRIVHFGDDIIILLEHKGYDKPCFIDAADYPLVKDYRWHASKSGKTFYASRSHLRHPVPQAMHALIFGKDSPDHIDHDGLNNRRNNLRAASDSENQGNREGWGNVTGYKGVYRWPNNGKFYAQIKVGEERHNLGTFDTAIEAACAYNEAAKKYFGVFAWLNDVDGHYLILNQG